jgi:hypothetical protein
MNNGGQGSLGLYATPFNDDTNYMAVLGGGTEEISYANLKNAFGLYWGSVDLYNSLSFYNGNNLVAMITGADVDPPISANGNQTSTSSNAYILISGLDTFNRVEVTSGANSFEFDNVVAGVASSSLTTPVPEPSTWVMLMAGFAGLGYVAVRRGDRRISRVIA